MPDWLRGSFEGDAHLTLTTIATRQVAALAFGCVVAAIFRFTTSKSGEGPRSLMATLVLLSVLISMISSVIGDNVARAFSLVGALSIVRFRTVVEDTRDTAFVIFAVGVGMAVGAGYFLMPLICVPVAALAAFLYRPRPTGSAWGSREGMLTLRIGTAFASAAFVEEVLGRRLDRWRLTAVGTARQGAALERTYAVRQREGEEVAPIVAELNALEGVQSVEWRQV
ncbi:MAG: DUF4956 domain-containing protein [Phycisphaerales bacterium]|nr:DUF4956 domain-containing protein [Phycisphaerales bacterium]